MAGCNMNDKLKIRGVMIIQTRQFVKARGPLLANWVTITVIE